VRTVIVDLGSQPPPAFSKQSFVNEKLENEVILEVFKGKSFLL
jgi:hypothetical protein